MKTKTMISFLVMVTVIVGSLLFQGTMARAAPPIPLPLGDIAVPEPTGVNGIIRNEDLVILLGKALFWDMQVGSDGTACATCHFHAGADSRTKNQLSPGLERVDDPSREEDPDVLFGSHDNEVYGYTAGTREGETRSGAQAGPNYDLQWADFPFHVLTNPDNRNSPVLFDMNDVASSQGTFEGLFFEVVPRDDEDFCDEPDDNPATNPFIVDGIPIRKVEPRNTPTVINSVFNHRNFWDGRANNIFNGVDPLGLRGKTGRVVKYDRTVLPLRATLVNLGSSINNASLASQAVGPPLSDFEMSCANRSFPDVGRKLLSLRPLALQEVHPDDSVLGPYADTSGTGLQGFTYYSLIRYAFHSDYWRARGKFSINDSGTLVADPDGYTHMELNFSLFYGLALQLYQATLVADETPFDKFREANRDLVNGGAGTVETADVTPVNGFGAKELLGLDVFLNKGRCINCHAGTEFTGASVRLRANTEGNNAEAIELMPMAVGTAVYDGGFYNIGVRPTFEDLGVGKDLAGYPLSFSRQAVDGPKIDEFNIPDLNNVTRVAVDGAFKVPTIRNVELTGPYFHNGGEATLMDVVEFYDRGGNRKDFVEDCLDENGNQFLDEFGDPLVALDDNGEPVLDENGDPIPLQKDTSGFGDANDLSRCSNLDPDIVRLELTEEEADALVAFMIALTDPRVKDESEPFDHPELIIPNGQVVDPETEEATDIPLTIPAVGAGGRTAQSLPKVGTFLGLDPYASTIEKYPPPPPPTE